MEYMAKNLKWIDTFHCNRSHCLVVNGRAETNIRILELEYFFTSIGMENAIGMFVQQ